MIAVTAFSSRISRSILSLFAAFSATYQAGMAAETVLVPWNHTWQYMHPLAGALPAGSGTVEPNSGPVKWYAPEAEFAGYTGPSFTASGTGYQAGSGPGPLGYGPADYFTQAGREFSALGTTLTLPPSGSRLTSYFRTTFEVPAGGTWGNVAIRFLMDDGGFVYLDGELVLAFNVMDVTDTYQGRGIDWFDNEIFLRRASLSKAAGSAVEADSARVMSAQGRTMKQVLSLAPGTHTLAVSLHNQSPTSSDNTLALQLVAETGPCFLGAEVSQVERDPGTDLTLPADDTVDFTLTVNGAGAAAGTWQLVSPPWIAASGAWGEGVRISGVPLSSFIGGKIPVIVRDGSNPDCQASTEVVLPRRIGTQQFAGPARPLFASPPAGWLTDERIPLWTGSAPTLVSTATDAVDLSAVAGDVLVTMTLGAEGSFTSASTGSYFVGYVTWQDGSGGSGTVNLAAAADLDASGRVENAELGAPAFPREFQLAARIPDAAVSAVVSCRMFTYLGGRIRLRNLSFIAPPASLYAAHAGLPLMNNFGTVTPADDVFTQRVLVLPFNVPPGSTGWTCAAPAASGGYPPAAPFTFGPLPMNTAPLVFGDASFPAISSGALGIQPPQRLLLNVATLSPGSGLRIANGPGPADDSATIGVSMYGLNVGPSWTLLTPGGVTPVTGSYGAQVTFTIPAPLPDDGVVWLNVADASYPGVTQTVRLRVPDNDAMGEITRPEGMAYFKAAADLPQSTVWTRTNLAHSISAGQDGITESVVSELIDLSNSGVMVVSVGLGFGGPAGYEREDKVKAELILDEGLATETTINLITPFDFGDGTSYVPGGQANGAPDGWINGYTGQASPADGFATAAAEYDANRSRDEFNRQNVPFGGANTSGVALNALIPAAASSARLRISSQGIQGGESVTARYITFMPWNLSPEAADDDADGMPNDFEGRYGLERFDPADAAVDSDRDDQSNLSEYYAGTSPRDPASVFTLSASGPAAGGGWQIKWRSVSQRLYRVTTSNSLDTGASWSPVSGWILATGSETSFTLPATADVRKFLRVELIE